MTVKNYPALSDFKPPLSKPIKTYPKISEPIFFSRETLQAYKFQFMYLVAMRDPSVRI